MELAKIYRYANVFYGQISKKAQVVAGQKFDIGDITEALSDRKGGLGIVYSQDPSRFADDRVMYALNEALQNDPDNFNPQDWTLTVTLSPQGVATVTVGSRLTGIDRKLFNSSVIKTAVENNMKKSGKELPSTNVTFAVPKWEY